ncbi:hypothetical protein ABK040_009014 [Willaertia magna]
MFLKGRRDALLFLLFSLMLLLCLVIVPCIKAQSITTVNNNNNSNNNELDNLYTSKEKLTKYINSLNDQINELSRTQTILETALLAINITSATTKSSSTEDFNTEKLENKKNKLLKQYNDIKLAKEELTLKLTFSKNALLVALSNISKILTNPNNFNQRPFTAFTTYASLSVTNGSSSIKMFGFNRYGYIAGDGVSGVENKITSPAFVDKSGVLKNKKIWKIACGTNHCIVLTTDNLLVGGNGYAWGDNAYSTNGNYNTADICIRMSTKGLLFYWEEMFDGQTSFTGRYNIPSTFPELFGLKVVDIACGYYAAAITLDDGSVYTFGANNGGRLGDGSTYADKSTPIKSII